MNLKPIIAVQKVNQFLFFPHQSFARTSQMPASPRGSLSPHREIRQGVRQLFGYRDLRAIGKEDIIHFIQNDGRFREIVF